MLTRYDPERAPDPQRWLATSEVDRIELCRRFHRRARIRLPNENMHAIIHQVVETQVAMGDETPAAATLQRLMDEGLSRHDAVHAIGKVLAEHMYDLLTQADIGSDPNEPYFRELHQLTAEKWLQSAIDSDDEEPETW